MSLKDKVFQDGVIVVLDNLEEKICYGGYIRNNISSIAYDSYTDDLKHKASKCYSIMKAINPFTNEVIYKRDEIDWSNVAVDTKVLVKDEGDDEWNKAYFSHKQGRYHCYRDGKTSFTSRGECYAWDYCKLADREHN